MCSEADGVPGACRREQPRPWPSAAHHSLPMRPEQPATLQAPFGAPALGGCARPIFPTTFSLGLFLKGFVHIHPFLERGGGREEERERDVDARETHQLAASHMHPNWGQTCSPGMCPGQGLNRRPSALWDDAHPTEPHRSGRHCTFSTFRHTNPHHRGTGASSAQHRKVLRGAAAWSDRPDHRARAGSGLPAVVCSVGSVTKFLEGQLPDRTSAVK